jgi:hypothetical protein
MNGSSKTIFTASGGSLPRGVCVSPLGHTCTLRVATVDCGALSRHRQLRAVGASSNAWYRLLDERFFSSLVPLTPSPKFFTRGSPLAQLAVTLEAVIVTDSKQNFVRLMYNSLPQL